jgi:PAS domain S-box-containing protein
MKVATVEEAFSAPGMDEAIDSARLASGTELERFFELSSELLGFGSGGYLRRVNPAFEATLGYSRQELLSRPFLDFVHPDDRIPTREASVTCARRRGMTQLEHRCIRSDGSEVWLEWKVVADHQGWLYGAGRDVTQRRREQDRLCMAQPMLAASHRELSVLAEQQAALRRLALRLRTAEAALPCELRAVKEQIDDAITDLAGVCTDLREIFRGIHPTIVSHGGLGPALEKLARRSAVPVRLDVAVERRLSRSVEVAAYYVVAEALTNTAKYAHASEIGVRVEAKGPNLHLSIDDDGVGGADLGQGSGLIGLIDRVEALGGCLEIASRAGIGTSLLAEIPLEAE